MPDDSLHEDEIPRFCIAPTLVQCLLSAGYPKEQVPDWEHRLGLRLKGAVVELKVPVTLFIYEVQCTEEVVYDPLHHGIADLHLSEERWLRDQDIGAGSMVTLVEIGQVVATEQLQTDIRLWLQGRAKPIDEEEAWERSGVEGPPWKWVG